MNGELANRTVNRCKLDKRLKANDNSVENISSGPRTRRKTPSHRQRHRVPNYNTHNRAVPCSAGASRRDTHHSKWDVMCTAVPTRRHSVCSCWENVTMCEGEEAMRIATESSRQFSPPTSARWNRFVSIRPQLCIVPHVRHSHSPISARGARTHTHSHGRHRVGADFEPLRTDFSFVLRRTRFKSLFLATQRHCVCDCDISFCE